MTSEFYDKKALLQSFLNHCQKSPGPVAQSFQRVGKEHSFHVLLSVCVHGNETGGLPGALRLIDWLEQRPEQFGGKLTIFLGNIAAFEKGTRFAEADLNRSFHENNPQTTHEAKRATELKPLIKSANVYFDFHQTMRPTLHPFYIFAFHEPSYLWARAAGGAEMMVTRGMQESFSNDGMCIDEYGRFNNIPSCTIELGIQGLNPFAENLSFLVMKNVLETAQQIATQSNTIENIASSKKDFTMVRICDRMNFSDRSMTLDESLKNFDWIEKNQLMGKSTQGEIRSPRAGYLLFPKSPPRDKQGLCLDPVPSELFMLAEKFPQHPREMFKS